MPKLNFVNWPGQLNLYLLLESEPEHRIRELKSVRVWHGQIRGIPNYNILRVIVACALISTCWCLPRRWWWIFLLFHSLPSFAIPRYSKSQTNCESFFFWGSDIRVEPAGLSAQKRWTAFNNFIWYASWDIRFLSTDDHKNGRHDFNFRVANTFCKSHSFYKMFPKLCLVVL